NSRLLRVGTDARSDAYLARCVHDWLSAEQRLGIDIDLRIFALVRSEDSQLEDALGLLPPVNTDVGRRAWRSGVLCGMLWVRGAQIRTQSLRGYNPFATLPDCDRLLVRMAVPWRPSRVVLSDNAWFDELTGRLIEDGIAELVGSIDQPNRFAE